MLMLNSLFSREFLDNAVGHIWDEVQFFSIRFGSLDRNSSLHRTVKGKEREGAYSYQSTDIREPCWLMLTLTLMLILKEWK